MDVSRYLDHAVLKPGMTRQEAESAIRQGVEYGVRTVCVRPCDIPLAQILSRDTQTGVCCVLDFPHGTGSAEGKEALARIYVDQGAAEIDMVMNYGLALSGMWDAVEDEVGRVTGQAHPHKVLVKVIFETSEWPLEMISRGVAACAAAGADFVKTSTGFSQCGATDGAVREMLRAAAGKIGVKASGGIRDYAAARKFLNMGCTRLGVGYSSTPAICSGSGAGESSY